MTAAATDMPGQTPRWKAPIIALLLTVAIWLVFTWPLPRLALDGIPFAAVKPQGDAHIERMRPGDHLQLLYHFWLLSDMLSGHTRWMHNLYEFNTGDDAARYAPGSYYAPFSVFFTIGHWLAGRAAGWNLAIFISLWLNLFFTFLLLRRYAAHELIAWSLCVMSVALPYLWFSVLGGSPAGFAAMWVPALLLGLDMAVREDRWSGGLLAGVAVLGACWSDTHVFFFSVLIIPAWCLFAFLHRADFSWTSPRHYRALALALLPTVILTLYALYYNQSSTEHLADTHAGEGRSLREVALFSPRAQGLFSWSELGTSNHIFIGYVMAALLAAGLLALLVRTIREPRANGRRLLIYALLLAGMAGIVLLALGPYGPWEGRALLAARKLIPPYGLIRQPAKIYCLMPVLLAVAGTLAVNVLSGRRGLRCAMGLAFACLLLLEYRRQVQAAICLLDDKQGAYEAVKQDAQLDRVPARALIVPLWPGDTHYSSLYEYYVSLYRIRMVNGYQPFVPVDYIKNIFERFQSVNMGSLTDDQLAELTSRGVHYIVLHEDAFPEKVSPFPVTFTLKNLLNHPRLRLLTQDGPVWAFKIHDQPQQRNEIGAGWKFIFPTRFFEGERNWRRSAETIEDAAASQGAFLRLSEPDATTYVPPARVPRTPGLRWMLRVRGMGSVVADRFLRDDSIGTITLNVDSDDWIWRDLPAADTGGYHPVAMSLTLIEGQVDLDLVILAAGEWAMPRPGASLELPAPCFFHAGFIDLELDGIVFETNRYSKRVVFYGPNLPLEPGLYRLDLAYSSRAPDGELIGMWHVECPPQTQLSRLDIRAGQPASLEFRIAQNLHMLTTFLYDSAYDLVLSRVTITRIE